MKISRTKTGYVHPIYGKSIKTKKYSNGSVGAYFRLSNGHNKHLFVSGPTKVRASQRGGSSDKVHSDPRWTGAGEVYLTKAQIKADVLQTWRDQEDGRENSEPVDFHNKFNAGYDAVLREWQEQNARWGDEEDWENMHPDRPDSQFRQSLWAISGV